MRVRWLTGAAMALLVGCAPVPAVSPAGVGVTGLLVTDVRTEATCAEQPPVGELSGVTLTFRDASGAVVGRTTTGALGMEELPEGEGMIGWRAFGCRFSAPWQAALPEADGYTAELGPAPPDRPGGFAGVELQPPLRVDAATLAANGYRWVIEIEPTYVVPAGG